MTELEEHILSEARSWIGTPWRAGGSMAKGAGVDCSRFAFLVFKACGLAPDIERELPPIDPIYCHSKKNRSLILDWLDSHPELCRKVGTTLEDARPCDMICSREGAIVHHIAIVDADGHHAIGAVARYGVMRYLVSDSEKKKIRAVYRILALC